ncbi:MAG TPA: hypothetical protein VGF86_03035, partial [Candidatus Tumulicola sp.]
MTARLADFTEDRENAIFCDATVGRELRLGAGDQTAVLIHDESRRLHLCPGALFGPGEPIAVLVSGNAHDGIDEAFPHRAAKDRVSFVIVVEQAECATVLGSKVENRLG